MKSDAPAPEAGADLEKIVLALEAGSKREVKAGYDAQALRAARANALRCLEAHSITAVDMNNRAFEEIHRVLATEYRAANYTGIMPKPFDRYHSDERFAHLFAYEDLQTMLSLLGDAKKQPENNAAMHEPSGHHTAYVRHRREESLQPAAGSVPSLS